MRRIAALGVFVCIVAGIFFSAPSRVSAQARAKQKTPAKQTKQKPAQPVFGFKDVVVEARRLSEKPYIDPKGKILAISNEQHRDIHFISDTAYWRTENLPFELQFFHAGSYYDRSVKLHEVTPKGPVAINFSPDYFNYSKNAAELREKIKGNMGFAGFRIHSNLNTASYKDEVALFLGASYFRAVAQDMRYGLSARGLAVDTAQAAGEEFPWFREFWIQRPGPKDTRITVYALLDSQRVTGAYSFVITPGKETLMDVEATLFLRKGVDKIGIAPMTSMFFYGENTNSHPRDWFQPEVHDSDGLMINMESGEWLWRPVCNPKSLWVNSFQADNVKGFGLMQRDLNFDHYQDLKNRYDRRPSLWCTPKGSWGKGSIELVQIPTEDDIHDNIVAYWRPEPWPAGKPASFAYNLSWEYPAAGKPPAGRITATRTESATPAGPKKFILDFEGGELAGLKAADGVEGVVDISSGGRLIEQQIYKNDVTGGWRLIFEVKSDENPTLAEKIMPEKRPIVEMRAFLRHGTNILTETWVCGSQL